MIKADSELASSLDSRPGELVVVDVVALLYFFGLIKKISFHAREERERQRRTGPKEFSKPEKSL